MKKGYCHIVAIIDRSGSMGGLEKDVIGGYNQFIKDQRKVDGHATISLIQFDNIYERNYEFKDIHSFVLLDERTYIPRGMTAMYDAIGTAITETGKSLRDMDESERPEKVIVLIQTDGHENASREYNAEQIKHMIEIQENDYSWEFVFLGANINAKVTASEIGIKTENAMEFMSNSRGVTCSYGSVSKNMTDVRLGKKADMAYESCDYTAQAEAGVESNIGS